MRFGWELRSSRLVCDFWRLWLRIRRVIWRRCGNLSWHQHVGCRGHDPCGNEALTQSNDVAKNTNSHPTVTVAPGCLPWILDQIGKDEIFQGHLLRLVLEVWKVKHFGVFGGQTFLTLFIHHTTPKCYSSCWLLTCLVLPLDLPRQSKPCSSLRKLCWINWFDEWLEVESCLVIMCKVWRLI